MRNPPVPSRERVNGARRPVFPAQAWLLLLFSGCGPTFDEQAATYDVETMGAELTRNGSGYVTSADLSHVPIGDRQLSSLVAMSKLESLTLDVTNVTDEGLQKLAALSSLQELHLLGSLPASGTRIIFGLDVADPSGVTAYDLGHLTGGVGARVWKATALPSCVRITSDHQLEMLLGGDAPVDIEAAIEASHKQGRLEFALLANEHEHAALIAAAQDQDDEVYQDGELVAAWRRLARAANGRPKEVGTEYDVAHRTRESGGETFSEFLVVFGKGDELRITGDHFRRATVEVDAEGRPCIGFQLDSDGGSRLHFLTASHLPQESLNFKSRLAILIDGVIHSAPSINDMINDRGIIQGDFTQREIEELVNALNSTKHEPSLRPKPIVVEPYSAGTSDGATMVTPAGVQQIKQALPACRVSVDF